MAIVGAMGLPGQAKVASDVPETIASLAQQATQARDANQLEDAKRLYRAALARQPSWAEGWWNLATIEYKQEHYVPASDGFRHVTLLTPKNGTAFALLGLCEYNLGRYNLSLKHLDQAGELGAADDTDLAPVILLHVALLLTKAGDFEGSQQQLALFVANGNHSEDLVAALGLSTLRMPLVPSEIPADKHDLVMKAGEASWQYNAHNVEDAKTLYANLAAQYPHEPNVHYAYGMYLMDADPSLAFEEFKRELEINPSQTSALLQVAFFQLQRGAPEEALRLARSVQVKEAGDYRVHLVMGRSYLQMDDPTKALPELKKAAVLSPRDFEIRNFLAEAYRKLGDRTDAAREQSEFARLKEEDGRQTKAGGWWYFAGQYYAKHQFREARDALAKITAQNPNDSAAWVMMGICDFELTDYRNALDHLVKAKANGTLHDAAMESARHYYMAILLSRSGSFDEASRELQWFKVKSSVEPQIMQAAGVIALRRSVLPSELPATDNDLVMKTGNAAWAFDLGHVREAKALYEQLVAEFPNEPNLHYLYAVCLAQSKENDPARRAFERELEITPAHADSQAQLALLDLQQGYSEKALREAETAVTMGPNGFLTHSVLGWALLANHQAERAVGEMAEAVRLSPDTGFTHYGLAQAFAADGNTAEAQKELATFKSLSQGSSSNAPATTHR